MRPHSRELDLAFVASMRASGTLILALSALLTPTSQQQNPLVDLGYEVHEGFYNVCLTNRLNGRKLTLEGFDQPVQVR